MAVGAIIHYALFPMHTATEHENADIDALVLLVHRLQGVMNYGPYISTPSHILFFPQKLIVEY